MQSYKGNIQSTRNTHQCLCNKSGLDWKGKPPGMQNEFVTIAADDNFGKTIGWTISQGRDFSATLPTDSFGMMINETAVKYKQFKEAIGQPVKAFDENYQVIGVVKDMVM